LISLEIIKKVKEGNFKKEIGITKIVYRPEENCDTLK
jgi:hypothetical protein